MNGNKEKTDLEFVQSYQAVKEMFQNVKVMSVKKKKEEKLEEEEKDTGMVKSNTEKINIGLEVLSDIRNICKKEYPEIEECTIIFEKEKDERKKTLEENNKKGRVCLGDGLSYQSTYEFYANQIFGIFAEKILEDRKYNISEEMNDIKRDLNFRYRSYMELLGIKGVDCEFIRK